MMEELKRSHSQLEKVFEGTVHAVAALSERWDPYTAGHSRRVARLACAIAREMKLPKDRIEGLQVAALLHDIGKTTVPAEILTKPGKLTPLEFMLVQGHPQVGSEILREIDFPWPVAEIVLQHHERLDGSGYPEGLKNGEIMLEARILAVADAVVAMASYRPYRPAFGIEEALDEIKRNRGKLYDPEVVDACVRLFSEGRFEFAEVASHSQ